MQFGTGVTPSGLQLDFNPIIEQFGLTGRYVLQHWQARPRGRRNYGYLIVNGNQSEYKTMIWSETVFECFPQTLQINELEHKTLPTAVLYYPDAQVKWSRQVGKWMIAPP